MEVHQVANVGHQPDSSRLYLAESGYVELRGEFVFQEDSLAICRGVPTNEKAGDFVYGYLEATVTHSCQEESTSPSLCCDEA
jgi:hypothetical protein